MHAGTYAHIHMEIHTRVHVGTHACIHVGTHATFVCMSAHTSVWVHTSLLYIDIFVGIHLDMYTSTRFGITCRVYVWLFRSLTLVCLVQSSVRFEQPSRFAVPTVPCAAHAHVRVHAPTQHGSHIYACTQMSRDSRTHVHAWRRCV